MFESVDERLRTGLAAPSIYANYLAARLANYTVLVSLEQDLCDPLGRAVFLSVGHVLFESVQSHLRSS